VRGDDDDDNDDDGDSIMMTMMMMLMMTTVGAGSLVALGLSNPGPAFNAMFTTLALSSMIGYQMRGVGDDDDDDDDDDDGGDHEP
jgi:hypothetical protein